MQVGRQEPLRAGLESLSQLQPQLLVHGVVGAALGVARRVLLGVHRGEQDLLVVAGQARRHVGQPQEHRVADDVEQGAGTRPGRSLTTLRNLRRLLRPSSTAVVVVLADRDLLEAVPLYPPAFLGALELRPEFRAEPVEQVEERRAVPSHEGPTQAEGLAADVGEDSGGDALGRAPPLVLMDLVTNQQVEEALHAVLHVVRKRVAGGAGLVGLPQGAAAVGAGVLAAVQVGVRQGHAVLVHDLGGAVGAAGDPEGLARLLVPQEPPPGRCPPLVHGGHPAVGQLGLLPAHHREEGAGAGGDAQPLQVGDGPDDDGAGAGHSHLHLPLPLGRQVGWAENEYPPEARHVRRGCCDEGLASSHLADHGGAPVGFEGEGGAPYGVLLRTQGLAEQAGHLVPVLRGPVEGRVGLHHPPGDGVLERVDERSEVHVFLLP